jgi:hypothetical protein
MTECISICKNPTVCHPALAGYWGIRIRASIAFALILRLWPLALSAQQQATNPTNVTGLLHSRKIAVGEKGVYAIQVDNGTLDEAPRTIDAPGLAIVFQGQNSNLRIINGVSNNQTIYYYTISGDAEGTFTIPALTLKVRGEPHTTKTAEVVIFKRKPGDLTLDASKPYFLRLTTPKTSLYVNQIVPLELTAFVRGQGSIYEIGAPDLKNENMVVQPFQRNVAQASIAIDAYEYSTAKVQSAIYPIQPGEQVLQPATLRCRFIDRSARSGEGFRSLFTQTVTRDLQSNSLTFNVKPLPKEGKPATFSGAVGDFDMEISASPLKLKTGDPISVDITIKGVGNFEMLAAPDFLMENPGSWQTYDARKIIDPNEKSDGVLSGKSTFTQIVIPKEIASELPPFEFSFFDPNTEKYVTRRTNPIPLEITADTRAASDSVPSMTGSQSAGSAPTIAAPIPSFDDILYIRTNTPHLRNIQASLPHRPAFWIIQLVPLLLLLWILGLAALRFAKARGFGAGKADKALDYHQLRSRIDESSARSDYYKKIEECLEAWKNQAQQALSSQPESVAVGFKALDSRCQWILYGAPDKDRNSPPNGRETDEAKQILDHLSQHLR